MDFRSVNGWVAFFILNLMSAGLFAGVWWLLRVERLPNWLIVLAVGAALLHLAAGLFWFKGLPRWGHGTLAENAGYVMADAYARDTMAWKLASSERPLPAAFVNNRRVDQYGGMLYLSALMYRYLPVPIHMPLLTLTLAAVVSALAVPFTWAFARIAWGELEARLAAWIIVFYPEAILLGSSQMREAFLITFIVAAFYGLLRYERDHSLTGLALIMGPLILCVPFSPPVAVLALTALILLAVVTRFSRLGIRIGQPRLWIGLGVLVILAFAGLYLVLRQFTPSGMVNPIEMLTWWINHTARWQAYINVHASGWMQKVLKGAPQSVKMTALVAYGVVQPFLPAALIAASRSSLWHWVAIWRAIGWTLMLALTIYAPILALRSRRNRAFNLTLSLIIWGVILIASYRAGGDLWDNPRYRTAFAGLQAALAAWVWIEHRRMADNWLRRALLAIGALLFWFLPWYLRRYTPFTWPVSDLIRTVGLGMMTAFLLVLWDWARTSPIFLKSPSEPALLEDDPLDPLPLA
ncbi:MAG: hypothetical protein A2W35_06855 [Chloroflexi bacterium RBG_16_57_11]|nr:MAG: hypothetical protein A2W35_06855 [Chloroflexi bacterium RBG_16_57_11]